MVAGDLPPTTPLMTTLSAAPARPTPWRSTRASFLAGLVLTAAATTAFPSAAGASSSSRHECDATLDRGSRVVYRFTDGNRRLANASITVQRQRGDRNAHCLQIRVPGRQVQARWRADFYRLRGDRCVADSQSIQNFTLRSIKTGFRVSRGTCLRWTYRITVDGKAYTASVHRRYR